MVRTALVTAALCSLALAPRAEGETLTLRDALARGRDGSAEVGAARARAEAGARTLDQARGYRKPTVRLQEVWMRTDSPADAFGLLLNQERFSLQDFSAGDPNNPDPTANALTRLEVSLPLYTGGELATRIEQARLAAASADATLAWQGESSALAAAEAYVRLSQAREQIALLEASLETLAAHVRLARAYVGQGMLVRSELLRAEVEQSRLEDLLSQARGQATVAQANLSFRLGAALDSRWELDPIASPPPLVEALESWLADAETRPDLEAARRLLAAGELEARALRSARRPKVGLVARHDLNDEGLFGASGDSTAILAQASVDLYGGGRHRAAAAAAEAEADAGRVEVEQFRRGIRLAVRAAYERARSSRERHRTALAAQQAAREAERITEERFEKGIVKTLDVLDAATARRDAETRELLARSEACLATLDLAVEAGRRPESVLAAGASPPSMHSEPKTDPRTHR